jgi:hypothetical protein
MANRVPRTDQYSLNEDMAGTEPAWMAPKEPESGPGHEIPAHNLVKIARCVPGSGGNVMIVVVQFPQCPKYSASTLRRSLVGGVGGCRVPLVTGHLAR